MSFEPVKDGLGWRNPDICDVVSPQEDFKSSLGDFHNEYIMEHSDPVHEMELSQQWTSPQNGHYLAGSGGRVRDDANIMSNDLEPDSLSSVSSTSGNNVSFSYNKAAAEKQPKSERQKGKLLTETEMEIMQKDDSQLTREELAMKKKAQNRLAQRAFRERKEGKLKELQNKLLESEVERHKLLEQLEEVKLQYVALRSENNVLRSNMSTANKSSKFTFPDSQEAFVQQMVNGPNSELNAATINKVYEEPQKKGSKVLAMGALWDYLQIKVEEEMYEGIDLVEVIHRLKGNEVCHGYGPAYPLSLVESTLRSVAQEQSLV